MRVAVIKMQNMTDRKTIKYFGFSCLVAISWSVSYKSNYRYEALLQQVSLSPLILMTNSCNYASVFPSLSQTDMVSSIIEHPWRHSLMCLLICCCTLKDIIFLFVPSDSCSLKTFCSSILLSDKRLNKIVHWVCMSFSFLAVIAHSRLLPKDMHALLTFYLKQAST